MKDKKFVLYDLNEKKGWILSSFKDEEDIHFSPLLQLGRTNFCNPWEDQDFHHHTTSLELYLLNEGSLWVVVDGNSIKMDGCSLLVVQPGISHSVVGGEGKINHYGMKIPHSEDNKILDETPSNIQKLKEKMKFITEEATLESSVGFYVDFNKQANQNQWILGHGEARFKTAELCLAYMNFQNITDFETAQHPNELHYHKESTEWYLTLEGGQKLLVNNEEIVVQEGNLLRIKEYTPHKLLHYVYPFRGVTIRTPDAPGDKIVLKED